MADLPAPGARTTVRTIRAWIALPAAAGLIALVAFASRTTPDSAGPGAIDLAPAMTVVEVIGYVGLFAGTGLLLLGLAVSRARVLRRRAAGAAAKQKQRAHTPWWANVLGLAVMAGMFVLQVVVVLAYVAEIQRLAAQANGNGDPGAPSGPDPGALGPAARDLTSLTIALAIVTILAVVLVAFAIRLRLRDDRIDGAGRDERQASTLAAAELSLEALRGEPDPRRAVIAAYAAMERSLSSAGFGRRRSEAPLEYLRRVLAAPTQVAEELATLTHLFQHAKFSRHVVDDSMRTGAINALERIRLAAGGHA